MKKTISLFLIFGLILSSIVLAQNVATNVINLPTTLPDQPIQYFIFVRVPEAVDLFFTFNPRDKALKLLNYAQRRDLEIYELAQKPNTALLINQTRQRKDDLLQEVETKLPELSDDDNKIVSDEYQKHIDVLKAVLQNAPEQAKPALTSVIEKAEIRKEAIVKIKETIKENREKQEGISSTTSTTTSSSTSSITGQGQIGHTGIGITY